MIKNTHYIPEKNWHRNWLLNAKFKKNDSTDNQAEKANQQQEQNLN